MARPLRFLLVGGFNTVASYGLFLFFVWLLGAGRYQLCLALQYIFFSFIAFALHKVFVFADTTTNIKKIIKQYTAAAMTWLASYALNAALLHLFVDMLAFNLYLAQLFAMVAVAVANYYGLKKFAFAKKKL